MGADAPVVNGSQHSPLAPSPTAVSTVLTRLPWDLVGRVHDLGGVSHDDSNHNKSSQLNRAH
jgi:hypothetical protein